jgi:hypothetical protein
MRFSPAKLPPWTEKTHFIYFGYAKIWLKLQNYIMLRLLSERIIQKEAGWTKPLRATSLWDFK